jgi:hypothetical protein
VSEPSDSEVYQTLLARAHRKTGRVPAATFVRQVLTVTAGGDGPLQCDALDAILRRCASAQAGDVDITKRPRGRALGLYRTRRRGSPAPPYRTLLRSADPLDGSCDCPDFVRNALGLCRHVIAVLGEVAAKRPTRRAQPVVDPVPLRWDPIRPLTGPGDWLARVRGWRMSHIHCRPTTVIRCASSGTRETPR